MNPQEFIKAYTIWKGVSPTVKSFNKKEYLSVEGSVKNDLYYILDGAVRAIYVSEDEEFTIRFGYKGSVIASLDSFFSQQPSQFYIQALRKTEALAIPRKDYFEFVHSSPEVLALHAQQIEGIVISMLDREIDLLTSSPMERYQRLIQRSPQVFQEIPMKYIAGYLRMSPETLSRLRNLDLNQD